MSTIMTLNPVEDNSTVKKPQDTTPPSAGMWLAYSAAILLYLTIQKYASEGLAPLAEKLSELNLTLSNDWLKIMDDPTNGDLAKIEYEATHGDGDTRASRVQVATSELNVHNTLYQQLQTFLSGMVQAGQQGVSDTSTTTALIEKMIEQGPIAQFANLYPRG